MGSPVSYYFFFGPKKSYMFCIINKWMYMYWIVYMYKKLEGGVFHDKF